MHRFFLPRSAAAATSGSAAPQSVEEVLLAGVATEEQFVEGSEEEVLLKAGAATATEMAVDRVQDVMIFSQNARCAVHANADAKGVVEKVEEGKEGEGEVKKVEGGGGGGGEEERKSLGQGAFWFVLMRVEGPVAAV